MFHMSAAFRLNFRLLLLCIVDELKIETFNTLNTPNIRQMASSILMQNISIPLISLLCKEGKNGNILFKLVIFIVLGIAWTWQHLHFHQGLHNFIIMEMSKINTSYSHNTNKNFVQQALCDATDIFIIISIKENGLFTCNNVLKILSIMLIAFSGFYYLHSK